MLDDGWTYLLVGDVKVHGGHMVVGVLGLLCASGATVGASAFSC